MPPTLTTKEFIRPNNDVISNIEMDKMVQDRVVEALGRVQGRHNDIKVNKVWVDDQYDHYDYPKQLELRNKGRSWAKDLRGDISLIDKATGKEIDREKAILVLITWKSATGITMNG